MGTDFASHYPTPGSMTNPGVLWALSVQLFYSMMCSHRTEHCSILVVTVPAFRKARPSGRCQDSGWVTNTEPQGQWGHHTQPGPSPLHLRCQAFPTRQLRTHRETCTHTLSTKHPFYFLYRVHTNSRHNKCRADWDSSMLKFPWMG